MLTLGLENSTETKKKRPGMTHLKQYQANSSTFKTQKGQIDPLVEWTFYS